MSGIVAEIRYVFRSLNKSRTYAAAFVITLGLGIGVNTAIFSVINGVLLHRTGTHRQLRAVQYPPYESGRGDSVGPSRGPGDDHSP